MTTQQISIVDVIMKELRNKATPWIWGMLQIELWEVKIALDCHLSTQSNVVEIKKIYWCKWWKRHHWTYNFNTDYQMKGKPNICRDCWELRK